MCRYPVHPGTIGRARTKIDGRDQYRSAIQCAGCALKVTCKYRVTYEELRRAMEKRGWVHLSMYDIRRGARTGFHCPKCAPGARKERT